jgi:hypothetical protein
MAKFSDGYRVLITNSHDWGSGGTGTVRSPHKAVINRTGDWIDGVARVERGIDGPTLVYWVDFDEPLDDRSEDGPYSSGSVEESALYLIPN